MTQDKGFQSLLEATLEFQKPEWHTPVDLGIKEFKKVVKGAVKSKAVQNKLIRGYKKRAWMEWTGVSRLRGTFPTHPNYGKSMEVEHSESDNTEININGK